MGCNAISYCETLAAYVECVSAFYQGTDQYFEIQLFDEEGLPLDLTEYSGIYLHLYTDGFNYAQYVWPYEEGKLSIEIIQDENSDSPIDVGIIGFNISSELSRRFLTGPLYAEIKLKKDSETTSGRPTYKTIACLRIGEIKQSLTKDIF
jgi:hypothetical protein